MELSQQYLIFRIAQERFALAIVHIREIAKVPSVAELPRAPPEIVGVVNFRGEIIGVFDLHRYLGLTRQEKLGRGARLIVAHTDRGQAGLLVDGVEQVMKLKFFAMEGLDPSSIPRGSNPRFLAGLVSNGEQSAPVLDLNAIFFTKA